MNLQGGLGDVTSNYYMPIVTPTCEKIQIIKHQNNIDYWITVHLWGNSVVGSKTFHSYLLSSSGLNLTPVVSNVGSVVIDTTGGNNPTIGYLKISSDQSRIAAAYYNMNLVDLLDFNNASGLLSNAMTFTNFYGEPYGVEFSPNNNLLYVSAQWPRSIYQYNLQAGSMSAIDSSRIQLNTSNLLTTGTGGSLQLAPDKKIYYTKNNHDSLGVINNPNAIGFSCNYNDNGFYLAGKITTLGLPNNIIYDSQVITNIEEGSSETNDLSGVNIYPNPANNVINVRLGNITTAVNFTLTSIDGKVVYKANNINDNKAVIDISNNAKGVYFLKIETNNQQNIYKVIKQ